MSQKEHHILPHHYVYFLELCHIKLDELVIALTLTLLMKALAIAHMHSPTNQSIE